MPYSNFFSLEKRVNFLLSTKITYIPRMYYYLDMSLWKVQGQCRKVCNLWSHSRSMSEKVSDACPFDNFPIKKHWRFLFQTNIVCDLRCHDLDKMSFEHTQGHWQKRAKTCANSNVQLEKHWFSTCSLYITQERWVQNSHNSRSIN